MRLMVIKPKAENAIELSVTDPDGKSAMVIYIYADDLPPMIRIVAQEPKELTVSVSDLHHTGIRQNVIAVRLDLPTTEVRKVVP